MRGLLINAYYLCCLEIGMNIGYGVYHGNAYPSINVVLLLAIALYFRREIRRCAQ